MSNLRKNVVVVGGGLAGVALARSLSSSLDFKKYNLLLVDQRSFSIFLIATARATTYDVDDLDNAAFLPYDKIFSNGKGSFLEGTVRAIEKTAGEPGGRIVLDSGVHVHWSVLVIATGSRWEGPLAFGNDREEVMLFIKENRENIKNAKSVLIVGGGAVGIGTRLSPSPPEYRFTVLVITQKSPARSVMWRPYVFSMNPSIMF